MTTDQLTHNKQLVEAFIHELFTKGNLEAVDRYLTPDFRQARLEPLGSRRQALRTVVINTTNGRDWFIDRTLELLPRGVTIFAVTLKRSKLDPFTLLHERYQRNKMVHLRPLPELEAQQKAYPDTAHDDQIDSVCLGVEHFYGELDSVIRSR